MRLYPFKLWVRREKAGVISEGPCWCCTYGYWMHCCGSLNELWWDVLVFWKSDFNIVG